MKRRQRWAIALCLSLVAVAHFSVPYLFTNDGPQHLLSAYVNYHYDAPGSRLPEDWLLGAALTDHGYNQVFWIVHHAVDWQTAHVIASGLPLLVCLLGWLLLVGQSGLWPIRYALLTGASIPWHFWLGLLPFQYSLAFAPFILGITLRTPSSRAHVISSLLLLLQCACHPVPAMFTGACVFLIHTLRASLRGAMTSIVIGLPSGGLALLVNMMTFGSGGLVWDTKDDLLRALLELYIPGPQVFRAVLFGFLLVFTLGGLARCISGREAVKREHLALFVIGVAGVAATPFIPFEVQGWQLVGGRVVPFAAPLLLIFSPIVLLWRQKSPLVAVTTCGAVVWTLSYLGWVTLTKADLRNAYDDAYTPLRQRLPRLDGLSWELQLYSMQKQPDPVPEIRYFGGHMHMAQLLALNVGGAPNYSQATEGTLHSILVRRLRPPRFHDGVLGKASPENLWASYRQQSEHREVHIAGALALTYPHEVLVFSGEPTDSRGVERAGYTVHRLGGTPHGLAIGYATPTLRCSVLVHANTLAGDAIEVGALPHGEVLDVVPLRAGPLELLIDDLPCATYWLRLVESKVQSSETGGYSRIIDLRTDWSELPLIAVVPEPSP